MKILATLALAATVFVASTAMAQPEPSDIGVFADQAGTFSTTTVTPFVSAFMYVIAFDLPAFNAYEFSVQGLQASGATVLGTVLFGPGPVNIGTFPDYIVGSGGCLEGPGAVALATINYIYLAAPPSDTAICIDGVTLSSFASGRPGYNRCPSDELVEFGVAQNGEGRYPDGCLIVNATLDGPVDGDEASFGQVKARF